MEILEVKEIYGAKFYSISEAARKIGVSVQTLISWDKKGEISPYKNYLGWRMYAEEHIEKGRERINPLTEIDKSFRDRYL